MLPERGSGLSRSHNLQQPENMSCGHAVAELADERGPTIRSVVGT